MVNKNFLRLNEQNYWAVCQMRGVECSFAPNAGSLTTIRISLSDKEVQAIKDLKEKGEAITDIGLLMKDGNKVRIYNKEKNSLAESETKVISPIKRLFFDIETTPMVVYSWRIGSKINISYDNIIDSWKIITICYKWENEDEVHSIRWDSEQSDKSMLEEFIEIANEADELIGHNADRFDIKKVRTRCLFHHIPAFPKYRSLDTLKKARGNFAFDSNKLDAIAKYLGVGAKMEHEGFEMWVKVLKNDTEALSTMVDYCKQDVVVLEDVYHAMEHYIKPNTHAGVHLLGAEYRYSCPICGEKHLNLIKTDVTQKGFVSRVVECSTCGHTYNISNKTYMVYLKHKLEGNL